MLGEITEALIDELKLLFDGTNVSVLFDSNLDNDTMPLHTIPCVVLKMTASPDYSIFSGGSTKVNFDWSLYVFEYEANSECAPDQGYSTSLLNIVDKIRKWFIAKNYSSTLLNDLIDNNSFSLTLAGLQPTQRLIQENGQIVGFVINYVGAAIDTTTSYIQYSEKTLKQVTNLDDIKFLKVDNDEISIDQPANSTGSFNLTSNTTWSITNTNNWLTVLPVNDFGNDTVNLKCTANNTASERIGIITISGVGVSNVTVTITQSA